MKTKTETKRMAILKAAAEVFQELGFGRTSMSEIRKRIGGSKATLYNYFPSKERLFFEVMYQAKDVELDTVVGLLRPDAPNVRAALRHFGRELIRFMYTPNAIAIRELAIAESGHSDIGRMCFERSTSPIELHVADFLERAMRRGDLRTADPRYAAIHLLSLLESEYLQRVLFGGAAPPTFVAADSAARRAVDTFVRGYSKRA